MNKVIKVAIPVEPETAAALADARRLAVVGRLIDRMIRPTQGDDPLTAVLEATRRAARDGGLTDEDIEAELEIWRPERTL